MIAVLGFIDLAIAIVGDKLFLGTTISLYQEWGLVVIFSALIGAMFLPKSES